MWRPALVGVATITVVLLAGAPAGGQGHDTIGPNGAPGHRCAGTNVSAVCPIETVAKSGTFVARALGLHNPSDASLGGLDHHPRETWGASRPAPGLMRTHQLDRLTVHHSGVRSVVPGPDEFRLWESWHRNRGWGDIAYHVIVGSDGSVYEARDLRFAGDTGTNYNPAGHFLVVLEGNFEVQQPTSAQIASLVTVLAWVANTYDIDPATLSGHRDHAATACPGEFLYSLIESGQLEAMVRAEMASA